MSLTLTDEQVSELERALQALVKLADEEKRANELRVSATEIIYDLLLRNPERDYTAVPHA